MTTKIKTPSRLSLEILELANEMRANDTLDEAGFRKITLREFAEAAPTAAPLTADDIRALAISPKWSVA